MVLLLELFVDPCWDGARTEPDTDNSDLTSVTSGSSISLVGSMSCGAGTSWAKHVQVW